ncbi:MAG: peptidase [Bacilli bacterium]|nr:peptidase [Bacilli bacterium]
MKKLFSIVSILFMAFILVGCEKTVVQDHEISFEFINEYGETSTKTVSYKEDYEGSFQELMTEHLNFTFSVSDFGTMLLGIEGLEPKTGAYISISKNGVPSSVGIDLIEYENKDEFSFEVVWWDQLEKSVDDAIQLFLQNQADDFVNDNAIDYMVLLGLELLGLTNDYVTEQEIFAIVENMTLATTADYFKAIMLLNVADLSVDSYLEEFKTIAMPGLYGQTAYGLLTFDSRESSVDYSDFQAAAISDLVINTPFDQGLDSGGISIVALSNYVDEDGVPALIGDYVTWIQNSQLEFGGVKTRDMVWGETTYPGTENASSMSQVIIGLIANNIDPKGALFSKGDYNLISRLLDFQTDTGSFDYILTDETPEDLFFSTPQAFLALVVYQTYSNSFEAVNPYNFN